MFIRHFKERNSDLIVRMGHSMSLWCHFLAAFHHSILELAGFYICKICIKTHLSWNLTTF